MTIVEHPDDSYGIRHGSAARTGRQYDAEPLEPFSLMLRIGARMERQSRCGGRFRVALREC